MRSRTTSGTSRRNRRERLVECRRRIGLGDGFATFCKQLRHVVCLRGVYDAALATGKVEWTRKRAHSAGPLTRETLLAALEGKQRNLIATLATVDIDAPLDWNGTPFTFALLTWEFVQHEAIHHGQWSIYASVGGSTHYSDGARHGASEYPGHVPLTQTGVSEPSAADAGAICG